MWVLNNWDSVYPKSYCLRVGYVLLAGLPCLPSMGEEVPKLTET
ncbi:rCG32997 [Rattus norvegicus]|uniref:RCG32997 n=1 Tax=Rattus norvegicus TaxID=10116 RepID=A6HI11_RAT|nr:rCG32997 [Rattus norvegicus]